MEKAVYLGLTEKVAKRIGISREEFEEGRIAETKRIIASYRQFELGEPTPGDSGTRPDT